MLQKVLVINDDDVLLILSGLMIKKANFANETITVNNGQKALNYLGSLLDENKKQNSISPELIFLDLHMPVIDGWEFLEIYSESYATQFPNTKIAILSSSVNPEDLRNLQKYPMVIEFISNTISFEILDRIKNKHFANYIPLHNNNIEANYSVA